MNVDILSYEPFTSYVSSNSIIRLNGFTFAVINKLAIGHSNSSCTITYENLFDYPFIDLPINTRLNNWDLGSFDKTSLDVDYLEEVERLKKAFIISDSSSLRCKKYRSVVFQAYEYFSFIFFIFDFDDIFSSPSLVESKGFNPILSSSPTNINRLLSFRSLGLELEHCISAKGSNMTFDFDVCGVDPTVGIPVFKHQYYVDGASFGNALFKKDNVYYFFRIKSFPRYREGNVCIVSYDIYQIDLKIKKCCIAECFGITE